MSFETDLVAVFNLLFGNRVYWDNLPEGMRVTQPTLLLEGGGGRGRQWYIDQTLSDKVHSRVRFTVMGPDEQTVRDLARTVEKTIAASTYQAQSYGNFSTHYSQAAKLYETVQDFGILYSDP